MKLLYCNTCRDIVKISYATRTCQCGATGGHYKQDGLNAVYYGPAIPLGFANSSFHEALDSQPEFGMGTNYNAFVIPKVCPTMVHVDLLDYIEIYEDLVDDTKYINKYKDALLELKTEKKIKIKNVFKNED